jgi:hypothetical protein
MAKLQAMPMGRGEYKGFRRIFLPEFAVGDEGVRCAYMAAGDHFYV